MSFDQQEPIPALRPLETIPITENGQRYVVLRDPSGFSDKMIAVAAEAVPLLALLDGQKSMEDIAEDVRQATGEELPPDQFAELIDLLEQSRFLQSEGFRDHRLAMEAQYRAQRHRDPILTQGGYPPDATALSGYLDHLLDSPPADDIEPEEPAKGLPAHGMVLPHIDFHRGGMTYGRTYRRLRSLLPDPEEGPLLVGVIGVAHQGAFAPVVAARKDFRTPLGDLKYDKAAVEILEKHLGDRPFVEEWSHRNEHSVELQVVWLQHLLKNRDITLLPMLAGILPGDEDGSSPLEHEDVRGTIAALREVERNHPGPVLWIGSVDFSHVGPRFGDKEPVSDDLAEEVERDDMDALEAVRRSDPELWWQTLARRDNRWRICGMNAVYILLQLLEGTRGHVIDYQQALSAQRDQMVSYAGAIFQ